MQFLVRNVVLQFALEIASSLNVDKAKLLASAGISEKSAYRENGHIPTAKLVEVVERAAQESSRKDFGILWGASADFRSFGAMGVAVAHHTTLSSAMSGLGEHLEQLGTGYSIVNRCQGQTAKMQIQNHLLTNPRPRHYTEGMVVMFIRFMRLLTSYNWEPTLVRFEHKPLGLEKNYGKGFGCKVEFGAESTSIFSSKAKWEQAINVAQSPVHAMIQQVLELADQIGNGTTKAKVAVLVPRLLATGNANATHIAAIMKLSSRTLQRKLADEGTTLKQIINEARELVVKEQLKLGHSRGDQLAKLLGYSDASAASRFVKTRTGTTSRDLKRQARSKSP